MKIALLVLNYNGRRFLEGFFEASSFLRHEKEAEVVLVDNASWDDSLALTRAKYPWVRVVRNDDNYGWGEGYNKAIETLRKEGHQYSHYLFINNDVFPTAEWWTKMLAAAKAAGPEVGEIGCRAVFAAGFLVEEPVSATSATPEALQIGVLEFGNRDEHTLTKTTRRNGGVQLKARIRPSRARLPARFRRGPQADRAIGYGWYVIQVRNAGKVAATVTAAPGFSLQATHAGTRLFLGTMARGEGPTSFVLPPEHAALIVRFVDDEKELVPLVQNSGVGLNGRFEGFDLHCYDAVDVSQNQRELVAVCGVAKLVSADNYHKINGFDPQFFMYYEDLDFSLRLRRAGLKPVVVADALLRHVHSGTSKAGSAFFNRQVAWSLLYFHFRHAGLFRRLRTWVRYLLIARRQERLEVYEPGASHVVALRKFRERFSTSYIAGTRS